MFTFFKASVVSLLASTMAARGVHLDVLHQDIRQQALGRKGLLIHPPVSIASSTCVALRQEAAPAAGPDAHVLESMGCTRREMVLAALATQLWRPQARLHTSIALGKTPKLAMLMLSLCSQSPVQNAAAAGTPGSMLLNALGIGNEPEPVLFPRKALNQVFAVLLMRSAYDAVDDLDFIPMVSWENRACGVMLAVQCVWLVCPSHVSVLTSPYACEGLLTAMGRMACLLYMLLLRAVARRKECSIKVDGKR